MADLRSLAEGLGWAGVRTYIQSGNLVFSVVETPGGTAPLPADLATDLERALAGRYPFPIPFLVRTADQWAALAADRPFGGWSDPKQLSVTLLEGPPDPSAWAALAPWRVGDDEIELAGDRVWVKTPGGYGRTKFTNDFLERKLGRRATTRNRATVEALADLLAQGGTP
jgi:uncharacterized protein (DUF1697 family)